MRSIFILRSATLFVFLLGGLFLFGQETLIPREVVFSPKDKSRVRLSSDGQLVYYQRMAPTTALCMVAPQAPTDSTCMELPGRLLDYRPTHTGQVLLVIQEGQQQRLYRMEQDGSGLKDLTKSSWLGLRLLALSSELPNVVALQIQTERDAAGIIYRYNFTADKAERVLPMGDFTDVFFDGQLNPKAGRRINSNGGSAIYRRHEDSWKQVFDYPFSVNDFIGGITGILSVSKDGRILYVTDNTARDKTTVVAVNIEKGTTYQLLKDDKVDLLPFGALIGEDGTPQMVLGVYAQPRRHFLDPNVEADYAWLDGKMDGQASVGDRSADDYFWLVRKLNGSATEYFWFARHEKRLISLFHDHPIHTYTPATRKAHEVTARDGLKLPVHVYLPPGADTDQDGIPDQPLPTVVYVHGGPWVGISHWNSWFHTRNFQLLANRGYAVINTEFRGSTGQGKAFIDKGDKQWGSAMLHDKLDITQWAVDQGISDADRLAIWGWSYGGYATNAALAFSPETFACGISMYGPCDLFAFVNLPTYADSRLWRNRVGNVRLEPDHHLLKSHSPQHHLDQIQAPLLLTTGSMDARVPVQHVDDFAAALAAAKKELIYFRYPEEVHDYRRPESWKSFWAAGEYFLHQQLGGRFQPAGAALENAGLEVVYGADWFEEVKRKSDAPSGQEK